MSHHCRQGLLLRERAIHELFPARRAKAAQVDRHSSDRKRPRLLELLGTTGTTGTSSAAPDVVGELRARTKSSQLAPCDGRCLLSLDTPSFSFFFSLQARSVAAFRQAD